MRKYKFILLLAGSSYCLLVILLVFLLNPNENINVIQSYVNDSKCVITSSYNSIYYRISGNENITIQYSVSNIGDNCTLLNSIIQESTYTGCWDIYAEYDINFLWNRYTHYNSYLSTSFFYLLISSDNFDSGISSSISTGLIDGLYITYNRSWFIYNNSISGFSPCQSYVVGDSRLDINCDLIYSTQKFICNIPEDYTKSNISLSFSINSITGAAVNFLKWLFWDKDEI